jgi:hypothetical protein
MALLLTSAVGFDNNQSARTSWQNKEGKMKRRDFLKLAGAGSMAAMLGGLSPQA